MIKQLINMDRHQPFILACSGGVDSMAIADFYKRGGKNFIVAYFNHGTPNADKYQWHVLDWAKLNDIKYLCGKLTKLRPASKSLEEYWREERYAWLTSFDLPVVTCHHLDDAVETWLFGCMHGRPKLPAVRNGLVMRPFLTTTKSELVSWCEKHNVPWVEDNTNTDVKFPRNRIRHNIVPEALNVNPGLSKVIKKKVLEQLNEL